MEEIYIIINKYKNESTLYYLYICRFTCQKCLKKEKGNDDEIVNYNPFSYYRLM